MKKLPRAKTPFQFYSRLHLKELTGLRAKTLPQLLYHLKTVPGSVIYHHTHHFLQQHERVVPSVPNDFAYWAGEVLGEGRLGEKLAAVDTIGAATIRQLRENIIEVIDDALKAMPSLGIKMAPSGQEFYFMKTTSFVFRAPYEAHDLKEFADCLERVTPSTIYFHIFESRLKFDQPTNHFSTWLKDALGENDLADRVARLNPYDYSLEVLRQRLIMLVRERVKEYLG